MTILSGVKIKSLIACGLIKVMAEIVFFLGAGVFHRVNFIFTTSWPLEIGKPTGQNAKGPLERSKIHSNWKKCLQVSDPLALFEKESGQRCFGLSHRVHISRHEVAHFLLCWSNTGNNYGLVVFMICKSWFCFPFQSTDRTSIFQSCWCILNSSDGHSPTPIPYPVRSIFHTRHALLRLWVEPQGNGSEHEARCFHLKAASKVLCPVAWKNFMTGLVKITD